MDWLSGTAPAPTASPPREIAQGRRRKAKGYGRNSNTEKENEVNGVDFHSLAKVGTRGWMDGAEEKWPFDDDERTRLCSDSPPKKATRASKRNAQRKKNTTAPAAASKPTSKKVNPAKKTKKAPQGVLGSSVDTAKSTLFHALSSPDSPALRRSNSKKRGVCGTPVEMLDDDVREEAKLLSDEASTPFKGRQRSRSRMFSPETESLANKNSTTFTSAGAWRRVAKSDDEDELDTSFEKLMQPPAARRSMTVSDSSPMISFSLLTGDPSALSQLLSSHSTYEDVKFLFKAIKSEEKKKVNQARKNVGFGSNQSSMIVPPNHWPSERKSRFLQWASSGSNESAFPGLGFPLRTAGAGVCFLQLPPGKNEHIQSIMEATMKLLKEKKNSKKSASKAPAVAKEEILERHSENDIISSATAATRITTNGNTRKRSSSFPHDAPVSASWPAAKRSNSNPHFDIDDEDGDVEMDFVVDNIASIAIDQSNHFSPPADPPANPPKKKHSNTKAKNTETASASTTVNANNNECEGFLRRRRSTEGPSSLSPMPTMDENNCDTSNNDELPPFPQRRITISPKLAGGKTPLQKTDRELLSSSSNETPMPKKAFWVSQPGSRDFGTSRPANPRTITKMLDHLENVNAVYGSGTDFPPAASVACCDGSPDDIEPGSDCEMDDIQPPTPPTSLSQTLAFDDEEEDEGEEDDTFSNAVPLPPFPASKGNDNDSDVDSDEDEDLFDAFDAHIPLMKPAQRDSTDPYPDKSGNGRINSTVRRRSSMFKPNSRRESVGASMLSLMALSPTNEAVETTSLALDEKRKRQSMAKHRRISLCAAALDTTVQIRPSSIIPSMISRDSHGFSSRFSAIGSSRFSMNTTAASSRRSFLPTSQTLRLGKPVRAITTDGDLTAPTICDSPISAGGKTRSDCIDSISVINGTAASGSPPSSSSHSPQSEVFGLHLNKILSHLDEYELLTIASLVCSVWADESTTCQATLMYLSVGCEDAMSSAQNTNSRSKSVDTDSDSDSDSDDEDAINSRSSTNMATTNDNASIVKSMLRPYGFLDRQFPHASFLSEGGLKKVYRVHNSSTNKQEALSVMDIDVIESNGELRIVGAELAVSSLLSSLVRRNICPNFVSTRGVFTCAFPPPASHWGSETSKAPKGKVYNPNKKTKFPRQPASSKAGRYQYIRMELCSKGDAEDFLGNQPTKTISTLEAGSLLFQMAFSLFVAKEKYNLKHYDVKLLNFLLQDGRTLFHTTDNDNNKDVCLQYALNDKTFNLIMPKDRSLIAKLADYGTADLRAESNGMPITLAQITTLENTPPEQLILGDDATQGHGHDNFGLGLCMLHLFTGHAPYEEILESVVCPESLRSKLQNIWENENENFGIVRSVILADVYDGEGEKDIILYDTIYRFLVLFGLPQKRYQYGGGKAAKVWAAIEGGLNISKSQYAKDCKIFSLETGSDIRIAEAREKLYENNGAGMTLLRSLVNFDPAQRATTFDALNSDFMVQLFEASNNRVPQGDTSVEVRKFQAFASKPDDKQ